MSDKKMSSNTRMTHFKVKKDHYLCNWHYKEEHTCNFKHSIKNLIKKKKINSIKKIKSIFITNYAKYVRNSYQLGRVIKKVVKGILQLYTCLIKYM